MRARVLTPVCNLSLSQTLIMQMSRREETRNSLPQLWPPLECLDWRVVRPEELRSYLLVAAGGWWWLLSEITNFPGPGRGGASTGELLCSHHYPASTAQLSSAQAQLNLQAVSTGGWLDPATAGPGFLHSQPEPASARYEETGEFSQGPSVTLIDQKIHCGSH